MRLALKPVLQPFTDKQIEPEPFRMPVISIRKSAGVAARGIKVK